MPSFVHHLPAVDATLNGLSALLVLLGYAAIRRKRVATHKALMLSAVGSSTLFLVCYLVCHYYKGATRFAGPQPWRLMYLAILASHTLLAVAVVPLVIATLTLALRGRIDRHRRLARWTLPVWLYVSITGVVVYFMLYVWFAPAAPPG